MALTSEEIQALLKKELVKATGGTIKSASQLPRPIQLGPLKWLDKSSNCRSRNCNSPCMIQVHGVSYCTTHALNALNEIILREMEHVNLDECTCRAGGYSKGNIHTIDCVLYDLKVVAV